MEKPNTDWKALIDYYESNPEKLKTRVHKAMFFEAVSQFNNQQNVSTQPKVQIHTPETCDTCRDLQSRSVNIIKEMFNINYTISNLTADLNVEIMHVKYDMSTTIDELVEYNAKLKANLGQLKVIENNRKQHCKL